MGAIGLFGGTFDPPHKGHIELAKDVLRKFSLDKIIFIPAGNPPHKTNKEITDKKHRYEMVKMSISNIPQFCLSDFDIKNHKPNYSYITIDYFKKCYKNDEIFFIIGADSFRDFPLWKNYRELLTMCNFIVVSRPGVDKNEYYKKFSGDENFSSVFFIDDVHYDLSSTELRESIKNKTPCKENFPQGVLEYIKEKELYR